MRARPTTSWKTSQPSCRAQKTRIETTRAKIDPDRECASTCVCARASHLMTRSLNDLVCGERERLVTQVCVQNLLQNFSAAHRTEEHGQRHAAEVTLVQTVTFPDSKHTPQHQTHKRTKNSSVT